MNARYFPGFSLVVISMHTDSSRNITCDKNIVCDVRKKALNHTTYKIQFTPNEISTAPANTLRYTSKIKINLHSYTQISVETFSICILTVFRSALEDDEHEYIF